MSGKIEIGLPIGGGGVSEFLILIVKIGSQSNHSGVVAAKTGGVRKENGKLVTGGELTEAVAEIDILSDATADENGSKRRLLGAVLIVGEEFVKFVEKVAKNARLSASGKIAKLRLGKGVFRFELGDKIASVSFETGKTEIEIVAIS